MSKRLTFKDFVPEKEVRAFVFLGYTDLQEVKQRANEWISRNDVEIINIETLFIPEVLASRGQSNEGAFLSQGKQLQFIRIWYWYLETDLAMARLRKLQELKGT